MHQTHVNNTYNAYIVDEQYIILKKKISESCYEENKMKEGEIVNGLGVGVVREGLI